MRIYKKEINNNTKLNKRQYLQKKGYEYSDEFKEFGIETYEKEITSEYSLIIRFDEEDYDFYIKLNECFETIEEQREIDNLQIAFNNVKRDFEEMMKCED